jgi:hypothetical protein
MPVNLKRKMMKKGTKNNAIIVIDQEGRKVSCYLGRLDG